MTIWKPLDVMKPLGMMHAVTSHPLTPVETGRVDLADRCWNLHLLTSCSSQKARGPLTETSDRSERDFPRTFIACISLSYNSVGDSGLLERCTIESVAAPKDAPEVATSRDPFPEPQSTGGMDSQTRY